MIERIILENFGSFRGRHEIDLAGRRFVAIVGPNWSGKTTLGDAIAWALFKKTRVPGQSPEDLVTWGEAKGGVEIHVAGAHPFRVLRGVGTSKRFELVGHEDARSGDATEAIERAVGMPHEDFVSTCFIKQSHLLGLADQRPAELRATLGRWTDRPEWPRIHKAAKNLVDKLDREIAALSARLVPGRSIEDARKELSQLRAVLTDRADKKRGDVRASMDRVEQEGAAAKTSLIEAQKALAPETERQSALKVLGEHEARVHSLSAIARTGFDGICPIDRERCPVADEITQRVGKRTALLNEARKGATEWGRKVATSVVAASRVSDLEGQVEALRAEWRELSASLEHLEAGVGAEGERAIGALEEQVRRLEEEAGTRKTAEAELAVVRRRRSALALVAHASSKLGIPALESREDLEWLELESSRLLEDLGTGFGLAFREDKELKRWADACVACGDLVDGPTCGSCGAPRERAKKDELRLVATFPGGRELPILAHSGGGQAFCAFALRVSAFRLLRLRRDAAWGTLFLDEVRRAMTPDNARAVSQAIARVLNLGVTQIFDVVHGPEQSAADGVLAVVPGPTGSSLRWVR